MITATHIGKMFLLVFAFTVLSLTKHTERVSHAQSKAIAEKKPTHENIRQEIAAIKKDIESDILIICKKVKK